MPHHSLLTRALNWLCFVLERWQLHWTVHPAHWVYVLAARAYMQSAMRDEAIGTLRPGAAHRGHIEESDIEDHASTVRTRSGTGEC